MSRSSSITLMWLEDYVMRKLLDLVEVELTTNILRVISQQLYYVCIIVKC